MRLFVGWARSAGLVCLALLLAAAPALAAAADLRVATTTSLDNSGLLAHLAPHFESLCECKLRILPVGSGKALAMARRGDVDALITHAPDDELAFVASGYGVDYRPIAYNYFLILAGGAAPNSLGIKSRGGSELPDALELLADIARAARPRSFVSRGDESGTHKKELALWRQATDKYDIAPDFAGDWYVSAGIGMGQAIVMADELGAYVLADAGTYLFFADKTALTVASRRDEKLRNVYSVMRVNPDKFPLAQHDLTRQELARQFAQWMVGEEAQRLIGAYRLRGHTLFYPAAH